MSFRPANGHGQESARPEGQAIAFMDTGTLTEMDKTMTTTTKIEEILSAKSEAGENAYLWLQSAAGDCILWPSKDASETDDDADAIGRWQLTVDEANALIETGQVDEIE